ncbi:Lrp/AsnC family transcriptional regulator [Candidatus Bathyarchaeota archaeon]|nr:Lrp/AsnC family transcriptional regulator [Candidatus Bathyarchaeota archaeon]MBL7080424.1 Lrp/AsnC family transcriptional regulator [Candidatus Bathyarchaeota archaeon]
MGINAEIDDLDRKILALLTDDSRLSYREIAKQLGVSHANVSGRIRRLEELNVILGYTVVTDPEAMELYPLCVRISAGPGADLSQIGRDVSEMEKAHVVMRVSGDCELLVLAMCDDRQEAMDVLQEISEVPGIDKAESHVVLESLKMSGKKLK